MKPLRLLLLLVITGLLGGSGTELRSQPLDSGQWEFFPVPTRERIGPDWGSYKNELRLQREEAVARHNYCPTSGCVIRIERVGVSPARVQRGRQAYLTLTYTILTADDVGIPVTITRELFFQGQSLGKIISRNLRTPNGTFDQEVVFTLPDNAAPGLYTLTTRVSTGYGQDTKSVTFTVD